MKAQVRALIFDEAPTIIPVEYFDYSNVFLVENIAKLPEYTGMNNYINKLEESKELLF